jgi:hypothetical protein
MGSVSLFPDRGLAVAATTNVSHALDAVDSFAQQVAEAFAR